MSLTSLLRSWVGLEKRSLIPEASNPSPSLGLGITGVKVTKDTALAYSPFWCAVKIIAESVASAPIKVYQKKGNTRKEIEGHHISRLLASPGSETTAYALKEALTVQAGCQGNGYAVIVRDNKYRPIELVLVPSTSVRLLRQTTGALIYEIKGSNKTLRVDPDSIIHYRGLSYDGINGLSVLSYMMQALSLGMATERYASKFFSNGGKPSGILKSDKTLSPESKKNLKASWDEAHSGIDNASRVALLEAGLSYERISITPEESQFLQTRKDLVSDISRFFRIPMHMLANLDRATFSNIGEQSLEFNKYTMLPWFKKLEEELSKKLLTEKEREEGYFLKFEMDNQLRGDIKTRYESHNIAIQAGFMTVNEVRRLEDLDPVPGGDELYRPLNMAPAKGEAKSLERKISHKADGVQTMDSDLNEGPIDDN